MTMIYHIPDPPKPRDSWSEAYLVQDTEITDLYASAVERAIAERGGHLFADDGQLRVKPTTMGVWIDERA